MLYCDCRMNFKVAFGIVCFFRCNLDHIIQITRDSHAIKSIDRSCRHHHPPPHLPHHRSHHLHRLHQLQQQLNLIKRRVSVSLPIIRVYVPRSVRPRIRSMSWILIETSISQSSEMRWGWERVERRDDRSDSLLDSTLIDPHPTRYHDVIGCMGVDMILVRWY